MQGITFYVRPIVRLGVQHWLGYAVDAVTGRVTWSVTGMSEGGVRAACMRRAAAATKQLSV